MSLGSKFKKFKFVEFGIIIVLTFWIIETLIDLYIHQHYESFLASLFPTELNELLLRLYISLIILIFDLVKY